MEMVNIFLPIIMSLLATTIGLLLQYFMVILKMKEDFAKDISEIRSRMTALETKTELFWRCIENKVVDMLKSYPTNIDKDVLLDKFVSKEITLDEVIILKTILEGELKLAEKEKFGYVLILGRLEQVIYDLRNEKHDKDSSDTV